MQENISFTGPPCMPKLEGPNGGNTYAGVTADTITMLVVIPSYGQAVDSSLAATGLAETPQQAEEDANNYAAFFNKHYEFYGRKLKIVTEFWQEGDPAAQRAEAKAMIAKYHPFVLGWGHIGGTPEAFADQVTQLGVLMIGGPSVADSWYKHVSLLGRVVSLERDPDLADIDRLSQRYEDKDFHDRERDSWSAWIEVDRWHGWGTD